MVRKAASEGPSLFCEWAVGTTVNSAMRKLRQERLEKEREDARRKRDVIKVEVMTDDESETESVRVTYPRGGKDGPAKGAGKASGAKQVRFERRPLKPALKKKGRRKRSDGSSGSDTLVSGSESGTDSRSVDTSQPSDSEGYSTDSSSSRRRKTHRSRRSKSISSEDTDAAYDSACSDCGKGIAKKRAKARRPRDKCSSDTESSTESEKADRDKKHVRRKHSKKKYSSRRSGYSSPKRNAFVVDSDSDAESGEKSPRSKKRDHRQKSKLASPKSKVPTSSRDPVDPKMYPEAMPGSHIRRPNLIRPIRAEVMQVEHAVEGPEDPRPNAFIDERNNIVRVYHGPAYGNPLGKLYPRRDPSLRPLPVGVPHPLENPYYHGFRNHQEQPLTGHIPTTLGVPYPSVPAAAPSPLGPVSGPQPYGSAQHPNFTDGLWGLGQNVHTSGTKVKTRSWTNNVGPRPSASLREANPNSRWGFPNGSARNFSGGSQKGGEDGKAGGGWGNDNPGTGGWDDTGNADKNSGGNGDCWTSAHNNGNWGTTTAGDGKSENADDKWESGNNDNAGKTNGAWSAPNNQDGRGSAWSDKNDNTWNGGNNQNPPQWDTNSQKNGNGNDAWDTTTKNNNNNSNNDDWGAVANDNSSSKSASNNVGFSAPPNSGSPPCKDQDNNVYGGVRENHVPGEWEGTPTGGGNASVPDWHDPTAAQSTKSPHKW